MSLNYPEAKDDGYWLKVDETMASWRAKMPTRELLDRCVYNSLVLHTHSMLQGLQQDVRRRQGEVWESQKKPISL